MSAIVERIQKTYEEETLFKQSTKNLIKASRKIKDSGQEYAESINNFADELINLLDKPCATKIPNLCTSLIAFGQTLKTIAKLQRKMSMSLTDVLETPLSNFLLYDFGEMEHLKHTVEKTSNDYQATITKLGKGIVNKKGRLDEDKVTSIEQELGRMKGVSDEAFQKFENSIKDIDKKKQTKLLNCLVTYMRSQQAFFANGHNEFTEISSTLNELETQIGVITSQTKGSSYEGLLSRLTGHGVWHKCWFVLKDCHLYRYKVKKEFDPESALNLLMCTVRVPPKSKQTNKNFFEIIQAGKKKPLQLQSDTPEERDAWVKAIQESISQALNAQDFSTHNMVKSLEKKNRDEEELTLRLLQAVPGNSTCADCNWKDPDWASINLGVLVCLECSGVHRSLGTHITKVRSLNLDKLDAELVLFMKELGNEKVNKILEANVGSEHSKPTPETERALRERWIQNKYRNKLFLPPLKANIEELSKEVYNLCGEKDKLVEMLLYVLQGANINWENKQDSKKTPLHQAVEANNLLYCELLVQNGAEIQAQDENGQTPIHVAASNDYYLCLNRLLRLGKLHVSRLVDDFKGISPLELAHTKGAENSIKLFGGSNIECTLTPEGSMEHVWYNDDSDDGSDADDAIEEPIVILDEEIVEKKENPLFKIKRKRRDSQPMGFTRPKSGSIGCAPAALSSGAKPTLTLSGDIAGNRVSKAPVLDFPSGPQGLPFVYPSSERGNGERSFDQKSGEKSGFSIIPPKLSLGNLSSSAPTVTIAPGVTPVITPKSGRYKEGGVTVLKTVTGGFTGIVELDENGKITLPDPSLAPGSSARKENRKSVALDIGKSLDKIVKKKGRS
eukprot:TRINITY_DN6522_c0_g1_i1.p1 TRINITY_DN6522_c0_g1~~TRINITY_DN6522_c0_g1_i1.p1  ORF type:complete len:844 (+),score=206.31 TRINITY_DN6522_c0_g1_i1:128-2659(+)